MRFDRRNLVTTDVEEVDVEVEEVKATEVVEEVVPKVEATVEEACEESVAAPKEVEPIEEVKEEVLEDVKEETLEERFAIPEFQPKVRTVKDRNGMSYFERVGATEEKIEPQVKEVEIAAEDVKSIEGVNEIPDGTEVVDGVKLVGDLPQSVEEDLSSVLSGSGEEVRETVEETPEWAKEPEVVHAHEEVRELEEVRDEVVSEVVEEAKEEVIPEPIVKEETPKETETQKITLDVEVSFEKAWDKFVDNVIVPTLITSLDMLKERVRNEIAADLKKRPPEVK